MSIDTSFLRRCIKTLELALEGIGKHRDTDNALYDIYRAACVKEFELILEQSGKLLRRRLTSFFAGNREADRLTFKDLFRHAVKYGLVDIETTERWFYYRDNRNDTAHNYGENFAEATLKLLPGFIADAKALADVIEAGDDGRSAASSAAAPLVSGGAVAETSARYRRMGIRQPSERAES